MTTVDVPVGGYTAQVLLDAGLPELAVIRTLVRAVRLTTGEAEVAVAWARTADADTVDTATSAQPA